MYTLNNILIAPGSVTNFQVSPLAATHITATWGAPADRGCPEVSNYEVTYTGVSRIAGCSLTHINSYTTRFMASTVSVRPYYSYTFVVKAVGGPTVESTIFSELLGELLSIQLFMHCLSS